MDVGVNVFRRVPFDDVTMDDIAREADVSRALLYHYFATKAEFFGAIWRRAHDRLYEQAQIRLGPDIRGAVAAAVGLHLDFYQQHAPLVMIANRSSIASDPAVRNSAAKDLAAMCAGILDACGATGHTRTIATAALAGWIAFIREATIVWLQGNELTRDDVLAMCMAAFDATAGAYLRVEPSSFTDAE